MFQQSTNDSIASKRGWDFDIWLATEYPKCYYDLEDVERENFIQTHHLEKSYYFNFLRRLNAHHRKWYYQLFFFSWFLIHCGMSLRGLESVHAYLGLMNRYSVQKIRKKIVDKQKEKLTGIINNPFQESKQITFFWIDNLFRLTSKHFRLDSTKTTDQSLNVTIMGIFLSHYNTTSNLTHVPYHKYLDFSREAYHFILQNIKDFNLINPKFAQLQDLIGHDLDYHAMIRNRRGLDNFHPLACLNYSPSSWIGQVESLLHIYNTYKGYQEPKVLLVDIGFFDHFISWTESSKQLKENFPLKDKFIFVFGFFHPYYILLKSLWSRYKDLIIQVAQTIQKKQNIYYPKKPFAGTIEKTLYFLFTTYIKHREKIDHIFAIGDPDKPEHPYSLFFRSLLPLWFKYAINLRLSLPGQGDALLSCFAQTLSLFHGKCLSHPKYLTTMTLMLCQWIAWKKVNHPIWQLFNHNPQLFNEESGEMCIEFLLRHSLRRDIAELTTDQIESDWILLGVSHEQFKEFSASTDYAEFRTSEQIFAHLFHESNILIDLQDEAAEAIVKFLDGSKVRMEKTDAPRIENIRIAWLESLNKVQEHFFSKPNWFPKIEAIADSNEYKLAKQTLPDLQSEKNPKI